MWTEMNNALVRKFEFKSFEDALRFINQIGDIANQLNHHPKILNEYNKVKISLTTHSEGNLVTEKDQEFTKKVDNLFRKNPSKNKNTTLFELNTDGGSRGNPGPSAIAYVIYSSEGSVVKKFKESIGISTNNQAEYLALLKGITECVKLGYKNLRIYMDSELIVNQLNGKYRVKNTELKSIYNSIKNIESKFDSVNFKYIPREKNTVADKLVNEALDETNA